MAGRTITVAGLTVTALLLTACGIDEEVARDLVAAVDAFSPPAGWDETGLADGPYAEDGFPQLYADSPLCFTSNCVHAVRQWLLSEEVEPVDLDALEQAIAANTDWELVYRPDCALDDDATDRQLPGHRGCVWEADVGDRYVLARLDRFNTLTPWRLRVTAQLDEYPSRRRHSPVVALERRTRAADLVSIADDFAAPEGWRLIDDTVVADPADCEQRSCLQVLRVWFDAQLDAPLLRELLSVPGWRLVETPASCSPGPDERGLQVDCRFVAHAEQAQLVLEATAIGQRGYEVRLTVTDR